MSKEEAAPSFGRHGSLGILISMSTAAVSRGLGLLMSRLVFLFAYLFFPHVMS